MTELLNLTGAALEKELAKIVRENPPIKRPWTEKEREIVFRLYRAGVPRKIIAQRLGRTIYAVNNQLDRTNLSGS